MSPGMVNRFGELISIGSGMNTALFPKPQPRSDVCVVVVLHSFYTILPGLDAIAGEVGKKNILVVLKNSSHNPEFSKYLQELGYRVTDLDKTAFKENPAKVCGVIQHFMDQNHLQKLYIMDHGGYFTYQIGEFVNQLPVCGIVEYALNGQKKYARDGVLSGLGVPYASLGESPLKIHSDRACGRLIADLMYDIVHTQRGIGSHIRGLTDIGVIGYGRLGSAAADRFAQSGGGPVRVFDINPAAMTAATGQGHDITPETPEDIVAACNLVLVGTDTAPITPAMYAAIQREVYIGTVTSADDSLGLEGLIKDGALQPMENGLNGVVTQYRTGSGHLVNLIHNGEAPNMRTEIGVDDPSIFLPIGLNSLACISMIRGEAITPQHLEDLERKTLIAYNNQIRKIQKGARRGDPGISR